MPRTPKITEASIMGDVAVPEGCQGLRASTRMRVLDIEALPAS